MPEQPPPRGRIHLLTLALLAGALAGTLLGCAGQPKPEPPSGPLLPPRDFTGSGETRVFPLQDAARRPFREATPSLAGIGASEQAQRRPPAASGGVSDITLAFDQTPLPAFIETVFGQMLHQSYSVDPAVAARKDLVTLRVPEGKTPAQAEAIVASVLGSYGITVGPPGPDGVRRIREGGDVNAVLPDVRRGRALPDVPQQLRPVFLLVDLQVVRAGEVAGWLRTIYGPKLQALEDNNRNAVLLGGQPEAVESALDAVRALDQPLMQGRSSLRINPVYWTADDLASELVKLLAAEGLSAGTTGSPGQPITIVPIQAGNALAIFASKPALLDHVAEWVRELDTPMARAGTGPAFLTYQAKNTDAKQLAATLNDILSGIAAPAQAPSQAAGQPAGQSPTGGEAPRTAQTASSRGGRVVVDPATNTLIIQAPPVEHPRLLDLIRTLDQPTKAALIEVTVAEVRVTDLYKLGVEWEVSSGNFKAASLTGLGAPGLSGDFKDVNLPKLGTQGLTAVYNGGSVRVALTALASQDRARILSTPRILARNGSTATIQVGQQVPIVTSQQTNAATGGQGILQAIEYRDTGVILNVKPVIHSSDRIDIEVTQEVSAAQSTSTGVSQSPTFITRKVATNLTLRDGATVVLGGLVQTIGGEGNTGIPLLKDIPVLGQLFRTNNNNQEQTEMLVVITPYIINSDADAEAITRAIRIRTDLSEPQVRPAKGGGKTSS